MNAGLVANLDSQTIRRPSSRVVFLVSLIIPLTIFAGVLIHPTQTFIGVPGDSQQTMWFMGWFWHAVMTGQNPLVTHMLNYPSGVNLMDNTSVIAEGILFGPLKWLVNATFMYNTMIFVNLYVTGVMGALILEEFGVRKRLAVVGGVFMQVIPYTTAQMAGHANLTVTMWVFAAFYVGIRVMNRHSRRHGPAGLLLGLLLAAEFYTSLEILTTTAMVVYSGLILAFLIARRETIQLVRQVGLRFFINFIVTCALLVLPGLLFFMRGPYLSHTFVPTWFNNVYVNDLVTFVFPSPAYLFSPVYIAHTAAVTEFALHLTGNFTEEDGYVGAFGILLLIWAVHKQWQVKYVRLFTSLIVWIAILSMGTHLHVAGTVTKFPLPWGVIAKLPLIGQALPSRLMFFADILIVILLFTGFDKALADNEKHVTRRNIVIAVLILFLTWLPILPYPSSNTPDSFATIAKGGTVYNRIQRKPTLILSNNFFEVMQGLAESGYAYPVVNVYGFQNNSPAQIAYRPLSYDGWPSGRKGQAMLDYLSSVIVSTKAEKVVVIPVRNNIPPSSLIEALTKLCGQPMKDNLHGTYVWNVPRELPAVWFGGDVSDPGSIIDSELSHQAEWAGERWSVHTQGENRVLTLSAPLASEIPGGVSIQLTGAVNKDVSLKPGQSTVIEVPKNGTVHVNVHPNLHQTGETAVQNINHHAVGVMVKLSPVN